MSKSGICSSDEEPDAEGQGAANFGVKTFNGDGPGDFGIGGGG